MRIDRNGQPLHQATVWLPAEVLALIRAERFNLSAFVREQIALVYSDGSPEEIMVQRSHLIDAARESIARQRQIDAARDADVERARAAVRVMRAEREAVQSRQAGIADALQTIVGKKAGQYRRVLPENDPYGDHINEWDALVAGVSRRCGTAVDPAEVAGALRALVAASA